MLHENPPWRFTVVLRYRHPISVPRAYSQYCTVEGSIEVDQSRVIPACLVADTIDLNVDALPPKVDSKPKTAASSPTSRQNCKFSLGLCRDASGSARVRLITCGYRVAAMGWRVSGGAYVVAGMGWRLSRPVSRCLRKCAGAPLD